MVRELITNRLSVAACHGAGQPLWLSQASKLASLGMASFRATTSGCIERALCSMPERAPRCLRAEAVAGCLPGRTWLRLWSTHCWNCRLNLEKRPNSP